MYIRLIDLYDGSFFRTTLDIADAYGCRVGWGPDGYGRISIHAWEYTNVDGIQTIRPAPEKEILVVRDVLLSMGVSQLEMAVLGVEAPSNPLIPTK